MRKLLVADDSTTIRRVIELTFAGEGIQVVSVGDGDEAIARIPIEHPDIVLADVTMPKRDGYEVSAFVKNHRELAHVPVLLMTGAFEPVDDTRARDAKSDGVIVKPFDPRQMVSRVRELLDAMPPPESATTSQSVGDHRALDDFFNRLDNALHARAATRPEASPAIPPHPETAAAVDVPTVETVLQTPPAEPPAARPPITDNEIDDITNRVLKRLSAEPFRDVIAAMVREAVRQIEHDAGRLGRT